MNYIFETWTDFICMDCKAALVEKDDGTFNCEVCRWNKINNGLEVTLKCECGSDKAGVPTHSNWCPRAGK